MRFLLIIFLFMGSLAAHDQTVVCIHGFMSGRGKFVSMARHLKDEGYRVLNWSYPSRKATIEEHAEALIFELKHQAETAPDQTMHFVTYSMGGLILRRALNHPDCPAQAKEGRVVMIAPPNQGAIYAHRLYHFPVIRKILGEHSGRQLMTSSFDVGEMPAELPVLVIAGTFGFNPLIPGRNDGKVAVQETFLSTPHYHDTVWAAHSWISFAPSVIEKTKHFLSGSVTWGL